MEGEECGRGIRSRLVGRRLELQPLSVGKEEPVAPGESVDCGSMVAGLGLGSAEVFSSMDGEETGRVGVVEGLQPSGEGTEEDASAAILGSGRVLTGFSLGSGELIGCIDEEETGRDIRPEIVGLQLFGVPPKEDKSGEAVGSGKILKGL